MAKFFLSERDRELVNQVVEIVLGRLQNSQTKDVIDLEDYPSTDFYIVRIPESGIPPLSQVGTSSFDTPGSRECTVYQVIDGELISAGFSILCLNLSESFLAGGWAKAVKDKFGSWVIDKIISGAASGTGTDACPVLWDGIHINDIQTDPNATYVLCVTADAFGYCVTKMELTPCNPGTGS